MVVALSESRPRGLLRRAAAETAGADECAECDERSEADASAGGHGAPKEGVDPGVGMRKDRQPTCDQVVRTSEMSQVSGSDPSLSTLQRKLTLPR